MYRILYIGKVLVSVRNSQCTEFCTLDREGLRCGTVYNCTPPDLLVSAKSGHRVQVYTEIPAFLRVQPAPAARGKSASAARAPKVKSPTGPRAKTLAG